MIETYKILNAVEVMDSDQFSRGLTVQSCATLLEVVQEAKQDVSQAELFQHEGDKSLE